MPEAHLRSIIAAANSVCGDIIVCTGDYVHERNSRREIDSVWPLLSRLRAPRGVFSVLGNHDHWADKDRSLEWLDRSGFDLRHKAIPIQRGGARIWLAGAGDLWEDDVGVDRAFQNVPPEECKIVLAHNPDTADFDFSARIDLMISGHTHGGQIDFPFLGTLVLPVKNKRYISGYLKTGRMGLYISRGIGWGVLPVRYNCSPEISLLHLHAERSSSIHCGASDLCACPAALSAVA
jgi:hypothetical protein